MDVARLPRDIVVHIAVQLPSADDILAMDLVCSAFATAPSTAQLALEARAAARGCALPRPLPPTFHSLREWLAFADRRDLIMRVWVRDSQRLAASVFHSIFIAGAPGSRKARGDVYTFGKGGHGRLGHGDEDTCTEPRAVRAFTHGPTIVGVAAGDSFSAMVDSDGAVWTCGRRAGGRLGHVFGDDEMAAQPESDDRQAVEPAALYPQRIPSLNGAVRITAVSAGQEHMLLLSADGGVYSCGHGDGGKLGLGEEAGAGEPVVALRPQRVAALDGHRARAVAVAAGGMHSLAVTAAGRVYAWGSACWGALGLEHEVVTTLPQLVHSVASLHVATVAAGDAHSVLLTSDGVVLSCGSGWNGRLGHGVEDHEYRFRVVDGLASLHGGMATAISAGGAHTLALLEDATVAAWGFGWCGQLGLPADASLLEPHRVRPLEARVIAIAAGATHSLALTDEGSVFTWGSAHEPGRLGRPHPPPYDATPREVGHAHRGGG